MNRRRGRHLVIAATLAALLAGAPGVARSAQPTFPTSEAAVAAFKSAIATDDNGQALLGLLGPENRDEIVGGDPAGARELLLQLRAESAEAIVTEQADDGSIILHLGRRGWPMPIPVVKTDAGWHFDTAAGLDEILDRRIGANELAAIDLCRAYVAAQRAYATSDHDANKIVEYAQRLVSSSGKQDGLYWPTEANQQPSPAAEFIATDPDYFSFLKAGEPYRGYFSRIVTKQGASAPGGAYDYVINGHMVAGFALVAWPAEYGRSGIMTFTCNQGGEVLQKDLGPKTAGLAPRITSYDPDKSWAPATD